MKIISITKEGPEIYVVEYGSSNIFGVYKITKRKVIEDKNSSLLPFTYADDGEYLHGRHGEYTLKWMSRNNVESFKA